MNDLTKTKEDIVAELRKRNREISALLKCTNIVMEQRTFEETAQSVYFLCKELTGATGGYVALLSDAGEENEVLFLDSGDRPCTVDPSLPMPIRGLRAESYHQNKVVYDNNFPESEWLKFLPAGHVSIDNVLFSPLRIQGKTKGLIGLANKPGGFNEDDARILSMVGDQLAIALSNSWNVESLEQREKHFRSVVETASEAIISINSDSDVTFWNRGAEIIFGYKAAYMIGKPVTTIIPEKYREAHIKGIKRVLSDGRRSKVIGKTVELEGLKKDGSLFPLELSLARWEIKGDTFFTAIIRDVSERKTIEEQLRSTAGKMQQYLDVAGVMLVALDREQRVILINRKGCRILGYKEKSILGKNWFDNFVPSHEREEVKKGFAKIMAGKLKPVEYFENPIINRKGEERLISWHNALLKDEEGNIIGSLSSGEDITERRQAEEELKKHRHHLEELVGERTREIEASEKRYRELLGSVTDYIYYVKVESGKPVSSTHGRGCIAVTGYSPDDYDKDSGLWYRMIHDDDKKAVEEKISLLLTGKNVGTFEHRIRHKNGQIRWITNTPVLRFDEKTGKLSAYEGLVHDITLRKSAEEELRKSNSMLDAINKAQSGVISEADPHVIFDELLADFLPLMESEFGFIAELLHGDEGEPLLQLRALTNIAWNDETRALYNQFRSEGMAFTNMETLFGAVVKTGKVVVSNDPLNDPRSGGLPPGHPPLNSFIGIPYPLKGKIKGIVCAANRPGGYDEESVAYLKPFLATCTSMVEAYRNVVKRKEAEDEIRHNAEALAESNRLKDLFIDIMRHDLMNPASLIMNFSEILMEEEEDPEKLDIMREIDLNADKLIDLIKNASKYSRLETMEEVDLEPMDLSAILRETIHSLGPDLERKEMTIAYRPRKGCTILANKMVGDVFANLLSNAIKFGPLRSKIEVHVRSRKNTWFISFQDRGPGIADEDKVRIFERFIRAAREGDKGFGLGLAIAKRIVDLHKGEIWVEDNPEGGSIFCVSLPKGERS